ncbi:hypothetical protein GH714_035781 [Hevea brasiliensis]|uniref:Uncharacterized protein n=1 Tax=Hevea brasiliensis TaxID=3981 RepID=A0A6A6KFK7_HEVBR|nr:hypothetical protein GH714_035781 [Hevea brasiliensis]
MAKNSKHINLTVLRLISNNDNGELDWDKMLDSEALKDVKPNDNVHKRVRYIEEEVQDEGHTASLIRSMKNEGDLSIVERLHGINSSQTSGLNEWSEFPALGDLLASREMNYKNSVLVVQQQFPSINSSAFVNIPINVVARKQSDDDP